MTTATHTTEAVAGMGAINWAQGALPPSALATRPHERVSSRYQFISTKQVVEMMTDEGFTVASASTRRARNPLSPQTGAHMLDFRHPDAPTIAGVAPRVVFMNSHDGSRRAKAMVGAFRFVCSNCLITGTTIEQVVARHAGDAAADLVQRMRELSKNTLPMFQQIERWSKIRLSSSRATEFAKLAAALRWPMTPELVKPEQLLAVRRPEDDAGDLWTVMNRVQEATTRASIETRSATGRRIVTRPLNEVTINAKFNAALWQLTEEFSA